MNNKVHIKTVILVGIYVCLGTLLWLIFPINGVSNLRYMNYKNTNTTNLDIRNINIAKKFIISAHTKIPISDEDLTCLEEITYGDYTYILFKIANTDNSPNYSIATLYKGKGASCSNFDDKTIFPSANANGIGDSFLAVGYVIKDPAMEKINLRYAGYYIRDPPPPSISLAVKDHLYDEEKVFFYIIPYTRSMAKNGYLFIE